jgi:hypothetical protein
MCFQRNLVVVNRWSISCAANSGGRNGVVDIAPGPDSASDGARSAEDEAREKRAVNKE